MSTAIFAVRDFIMSVKKLGMITLMEIAAVVAI
jgi:hypothetical protein